MRAVEGEDWAAGEPEAELGQVAEGPQQGRLFWRVGNRQLIVDADGVTVIELTLADGRPSRRRVIGVDGVVQDDAIIVPGLN
jgi:hypothetical protein